MNTKTLLIAMLCITLVGCAGIDTQTTSKCIVDGKKLNKETRATIKYRTKNKFEVSLDLKTDVNRYSEFRIRLDAKQGSGDAKVTTIGRSVESPDPTITDFSWLNATGTANNEGTLVLCVPDVPVGTKYKFDVEVGGIGSIDPRVEVTN